MPLPSPRAPWMRWAACAGADDPDLWFPDLREGGPMGFKRAEQRAVAVCTGQCPVRLQCAAYAFAAEADLGPSATRHGVYGGLTGSQRAEIEAQRRSA